MVTELNNETFFKRFQRSGSIDDLEDPKVRELNDKGFLVVKEGGKIFTTKGKRLVDSEKKHK